MGGAILDKNKMRSCVQLITYTVLLTALLIKIDTVIALLSQFFLLLIPVIVGAALAFILKLPFDKVNSLFERILPQKAKKSLL